MQRISSFLTPNDMNWNLRNTESRLNQVQNQLGTQQKLQNLRDDPVAAAQSTRLQSWQNRLEKFEKNSSQLQTDLRYTESTISKSQDIMQRLNELSIQGANGTYAPDDLKKMGVEVNELLNELVSLGNSKGPDGQALFGGDRNDSNPFRVLYGRTAGSGERVITQVDYVGTIGEKKTEISENTFIKANFPGNQVFWSDQQQIFSAADSQNYQVPQDTTIRIDGKEISLKAGDNIQTIMGKINQAPIAVKATLDPVTNGLNLTTTVPHQLMLEDGKGGSVLQNLGILSTRPGLSAPTNYHQDAKVFGGSLFDSVIKLRDAMYSGSNEALGGQALGGIQNGLKNLQNTLADLGARDSRLDETAKVLQDQIPKVVEKNSNLIDLDMAEGVTRLKMLDQTHEATLKATAKLSSVSLMDFLR